MAPPDQETPARTPPGLAIARDPEKEEPGEQLTEDQTEVVCAVAAQHIAQSPDLSQAPPLDRSKLKLAKRRSAPAKRRTKYKKGQGPNGSTRGRVPIKRNATTGSIQNAAEANNVLVSFAKQRQNEKGKPVLK